MKKYVFLTPAIGNFGGAQMFTNNKLQYLEKEGWYVIVLYTTIFDNYMLPLLERYKDNFIDKILSYRPYELTQRERISIIKKVKNIVGDADEIVLESHFLSLSWWGELFAKEMGARHIINFLEEPVITYKDKEYKYFEFKLKRWEFMNSCENSLHRVFKEYFRPEFLQYANNVKFVCSNVTSNNDREDIKIVKADYTILSLGRLDKPYIKPMVLSVRDFIESYSTITFNLMFIGGSNDGESEKEIQMLFSNINNVNIYLLGYMFPVPISLLKQCDVSIASANSVLVTAGVGVPTICVDMNDYKAIGIYGTTTTHNFRRTTEAQVEIASLLEDVLITHKTNLKESILSQKNEMEVEFDKQLAYLGKANVDKDYFDVVSIYSFKEIAIRRIKRLIRIIVGRRTYSKICEYVKK